MIRDIKRRISIEIMMIEITSIEEIVVQISIEEEEIIEIIIGIEIEIIEIIEIIIVILIEIITEIIVITIEIIITIEISEDRIEIIIEDRIIGIILEDRINKEKDRIEDFNKESKMKEDSIKAFKTTEVIFSQETKIISNNNLNQKLSNKSIHL